MLNDIGQRWKWWRSKTMTMPFCAISAMRTQSAANLKYFISVKVNISLSEINWIENIVFSYGTVVVRILCYVFDIHEKIPKLYFPQKVYSHCRIGYCHHFVSSCSCLLVSLSVLFVVPAWQLIFIPGIGKSRRLHLKAANQIPLSKLLF